MALQEQLPPKKEKKKKKKKKKVSELHIKEEISVREKAK